MTHQPNTTGPAALAYTSDYVIRLLLERHHIRARLYNPGGSVILTQSSLPDFERGGIAYSSEIGNSFHLDLMEIEEQLAELPKGMVDELLAYIDNLVNENANYYLGARGGIHIRERREGALKIIADHMNQSQEEQKENNARNGD